MSCHRAGFYFATFSLTALSPLTSQAGENYLRPDLLVEPAKLATHADLFVVLDARPREAYDAGHIPGAVSVPHAEWEKAFHEDEDCNPAGWGKRIAALGISGEKPVVVYDDNLSKDAARIWWILRFHGVRDVRLLNGGWRGWRSGELPVSIEAVEPQPSGFRPAPQPDIFRDKAAVMAALKNPAAVQIVDARSEGEHCGDDPLKNARAGAIPGAKHLEWSDLLDTETARFKPADEIARLFSEAGIDPMRPTVTHCQSGGRASVMAFGLELMGGERVANYYRGWSEWVMPTTRRSRSRRRISPGPASRAPGEAGTAPRCSP